MVGPLSPGDAKRELVRILGVGGVAWDTGPKSHFLEEIKKDDLKIVDCLNVLRGGVIEPAEWNDKYEEFRYRVRTQKICVVVTFPSEVEVFIVTAWRIK